jgi:hypothetical protein
VIYEDADGKRTTMKKSYWLLLGKVN